MGNDLEVLGSQIFQCLRVGGERAALRQLEVEHSDVQPPLGGDLGVKLAERAGGGVAGVGHEGLALDLTAGVDLLEHAAGHVNLAPDDKTGQLLRQRHGDGADGAEVLRHVLAHLSVAPGRTTDEHAVTVLQRHGQAVNLGLDAVYRALQRHFLQKAADLIVVEYVL